MKKFDASIILTSLNESCFLKESISEIKKVMNDTKFSYEIIIVDDGSEENDREKLKKIVNEEKSILIKTVYHERNLGRGASVSDGIKASYGLAVGFIDPDLEIPARYLPAFIRAVLDGSDVTVAIRSYKITAKAFWRIFSSGVYNLLVQKFLRIPLADTESGLKFFNREKILPLLNFIKDKRWFWDTEIMTRSYLNGFKIKEIPCVVVKKTDKPSTVSLFKDTIYYLSKLFEFKKTLKK